MSDPFDDIEEDVPEKATKRVTIDVDMADAQFVEAWAVFKNAAHLVKTGKRRRRLLTLKTQSERLYKERVNELKAQLADMERVLGPLPHPDDLEAMERYARRAEVWAKKRG